MEIEGVIPLSSDECFAVGLLEGLRWARSPLAADVGLYSIHWSDNTTPIGPCLVAPSVIPDPQTLTLKTVVNGQVLQDGTTA